MSNWDWVKPLDGSKYTTIEVPDHAGMWVIGGQRGLKFAVIERPRWLTRFLMKWLVEWEWEDKT